MSETSTEQTRVFVSGLPRKLTSEQLAAHFREKYSVTDAHVFPERRIGFVGFHDNITAQNAVKYFDRSYIRMSKISVDLAKPIEVKNDINGQAIPVSQRDSNKRQSGRKDRTNGPSTKIKILSNDSDEQNYESKKRKRDIEDDGEGARSEADITSHDYGKTSMPTPPLEELQNGYLNEMVDAKDEQQDFEPSQPTSDMDWLRGKTSRVLDLLQPEEVLPVVIEDDESSHSNSSSVENRNVDTVPDGESDMPADAASEIQPKVPNARLFIRNLAFDVTENDLKSRFDMFGKIQEMHVVTDTRKSIGKGMAFIQYSDKSHAEEALKTMDGVAFHGRLLHILPAADKRDTGLTEFDISKMPLKKQKAIRRKMDAASATFSWNSMYMNPDAVIASVASRLGVSKSDILDPTSSDAAVKQAHAETQIIAETKDYLKANGVNVEAFRNKSRDDRTVLLKNFSFGTHEAELRDLLEPHGQLTRFLMPPAGTMALAQFAEPHSVSQALKSLSYKNLNGTVLYLEKAPSGLLKESASIAPRQIATAEHLERDGEDTSLLPGIPVAVFIRNLSFRTTTQRLTEVFSPLAGFLSARVKTRTDPKRPSEILSMGFGFVEFASKPHAEAGISAMNGYRLDGHELIVKMSTKSTDVAEERRATDLGKRQTANKTKIVIKNLPFQATKKDIRTLFAHYGQLKSVRVPKKFDNTSRGFAFAEFVTAKEASSALEALTDTHLLGRRLVLDFVEEEAVDAEEQIKAIEKKVEQQSSRINLSKLISTGRKKFNVGGTEDDFA